MLHTRLSRPVRATAPRPLPTAARLLVAMLVAALPAVTTLGPGNAARAAAMTAPRSEIDDLIETFDTAFQQKRWPEVATAARYLGDELAVVEKDADKKRIIDTLTRGLRIYTDGAFVALRCADSLSPAGEDAAPVLAKALRDRKLEKEEDLAGLRQTLVRSLGLTASVKYVDKVLPYIDHKDPYTAAAAAEGLSAFEDATEKVRKKIAKALVAELVKAEASSTSGNRRATSSQNSGNTRYGIISDKFSTTLRYITGAEDVATKEWGTWLDENIKKKWDDDDEDGS